MGRGMRTFEEFSLLVIRVDESNNFIDCSVNSTTGNRLGKIQAGHQFNIYTGRPAPESIFEIDI